MSESEIKEFRGEVQSLRGLVTVGLLAFFIFSLPVNFFFWKQSRALSAQVQMARASINGYKNGGATTILEFWARLKEYSTTHPDFQPIINKYGEYFATSKVPTPAAPAPVPAPAPRKK